MTVSASQLVVKGGIWAPRATAGSTGMAVLLVDGPGVGQGTHAPEEGGVGAPPGGGEAARNEAVAGASPLGQGFEQQGDVFVGVGRDGVAVLGPDLVDVGGDVLDGGGGAPAGEPARRLADEDAGELAAADGEDLVRQR